MARLFCRAYSSDPIGYRTFPARERIHLHSNDKRACHGATMTRLIGISRLSKKYQKMVRSNSCRLSGCSMHAPVLGCLWAQAFRSVGSARVMNAARVCGRGAGTTDGEYCRTLELDGDRSRRSSLRLQLPARR